MPYSQSHNLPRLAPLALALLLAQQSAWAADEVQSVPTVQVTGSRILRAKAEGANPVTVIRADDLSRQGYKNVFDALQALTQNTGFTQGADYGNTFTPAANAISLRGLGPNHTLTLINGRRIADYPTAYSGSVNFVDLANVPSALIDRIEILSGGASAVYGSDAIAGVVNIILKKSTDGLRLNLKAGATEQGGGENARLQLTGGIEAGALSGIWGLELSARQPIWSRQRDFMADSTLQGAAPTAVFTRQDAGAKTYFDPGAGTCEALSGLFEGSVKRHTVKAGSYCATGRASPSYWTTQTGNRSSNFAALLNYQLNDKTELFAEGLLGFNTTENNTRGPSWTSLAATSGYFRNALTDKLETWTRRLAPEEIGGIDNFNREWRDRSGNLALGARGELGAWGYELVYNASVYHNKTPVPRLLANIDEFFLGKQQGVDAKGIPIFAPDPKRLFTALTPAEYAGVSGTSEGNNKAWTHSLGLSVSRELFQLPAGPLQFAALAEIGGQGFSNRSDPRLGQGVFYNTTDVALVKGTRQRSAFGAELHAPVTKQINATFAGRYDDYRFAGRSDDQFTYQGGLEFRPNDQLLLRANHATSFRAPDMNYIYSLETKGYYPSSTDYFRCAQTNQPLADCTYRNISPGFNFVRNGSRDLQSETGRSQGLGLVWSPNKDFDVSLDFWKIHIDDLVTNLSHDVLLRDEALCRTGAKDIGSPTCADALRRVRRNPADAVVRPGEVKEILVNPINAAQQSTRGFDLGGRYAWQTENAGRFQLGAKYTKVQKYVYRQFAGDTSSNKVGTRDFGDWPEKLVTTLSWSLGPLSSTLTVTRNGKIPDDDKGWIKPRTLLNLSAGYELSERSRLNVIINNLTNSVPRDSSSGWPFYPVGYYSPHGRQGWIEFEHKFGA
ncbi:TonB-dependent receptor [Roseateles sp. DAIF2]|uniref:TonB-dependent receptor domain-containing protein n=1 Tax=Roseateles sp. DAIF2 TaxID=2714952 RepID=UPI0018A2B79A|nr:TonB-dependent receptor [Roseateles sp. DAIF2]QPF75141.1 TonB-dependent receptor [Roseateles sp. DAIF2]